jgi:hypothetical protein
VASAAAFRVAVPADFMEEAAVSMEVAAEVMEEVAVATGDALGNSAESLIVTNVGTATASRRARCGFSETSSEGQGEDQTG